MGRLGKRARRAARCARGPTPLQTRRLHYGFVILTLTMLTVCVALGLGRFGYTSILPAMQQGLGLTNTQMGELQSWNLFGYLVSAVFAGMLATRYGPRRVIVIALLVTGLGLILTGLVPTFNGARVGRFLAGVGGAGANLPALGLVSAWVGTQRRGLAAGAAMGGSSLGLMLTGLLTPRILSRQGESGWRVCWFLEGGIALLVFVLCALFMRDRPADIGVTPLGETTDVPLHTGPDADTSALTGGRVWRSGLLWHLATIYFAFGISYISYATFFVRHLVGEGGFTIARAGLLWLQVGAVSGISGLLWGAISDHWGRRHALISVFLLQGMALLAFGFSQALPVLYLSAALFALTAWGIPALVVAALGDIFGPRLAPAALGFATLALGIGQVVGPFAAGWIADATQSFQPAFVAAGLIALVMGAGGSFLLPPTSRDPSRPRIATHRMDSLARTAALLGVLAARYRDSGLRSWCTGLKRPTVLPDPSGVGTERERIRMYIYEQVVEQIAKERIEEAERVADQMRAIRSSRVRDSARVRLGSAFVRLGQWIIGDRSTAPS